VECASKLQKEYAVGVPLNHRLVNRLEIRVAKFFPFRLGLFGRGLLSARFVQVVGLAIPYGYFSMGGSFAMQKLLIGKHAGTVFSNGIILRTPGEVHPVRSHECILSSFI
jgi:hypothetical protein